MHTKLRLRLPKRTHGGPHQWPWRRRTATAEDLAVQGARPQHLHRPGRWHGQGGAGGGGGGAGAQAQRPAELTYTVRSPRMRQGAHARMLTRTARKRQVHFCVRAWHLVRPAWLAPADPPLPGSRCTYGAEQHAGKAGWGAGRAVCVRACVCMSVCVWGGEGAMRGKAKRPPRDIHDKSTTQACLQCDGRRSLHCAAAAAGRGVHHWRAAPPPRLPSHCTCTHTHTRPRDVPRCVASIMGCSHHHAAGVHRCTAAATGTCHVPLPQDGHLLGKHAVRVRDAPRVHRSVSLLRYRHQQLRARQAGRGRGHGVQQLAWLRGVCCRRE